MIRTFGIEERIPEERLLDRYSIVVNQIPVRQVAEALRLVQGRDGGIVGQNRERQVGERVDEGRQDRRVEIFRVFAVHAHLKDGTKRVANAYHVCEFLHADFSRAKDLRQPVQDLDFECGLHVLDWVRMV